MGADVERGGQPVLTVREDGTLVVVCPACGNVYTTVPPTDLDMLRFWRDPRVTLVCAGQCGPGELPKFIAQTQERFNTTIGHWGVRSPAGSDGRVEVEVIVPLNRPTANGTEGEPPAGFEPADAD